MKRLRILKKLPIKKIVAGVVCTAMFVSAFTGCESNSKSKGFKVSFYGDGGTLVSGDAVQTVKDASEIVAPTYSMRGYVFDGWDIPLDTITDTITVKAQWKLATYKITYHLDGGKNNEHNPNYYNITSENFVLLPASKTAYAFDYWSFENGDRVTTIFAADARDLDLYAHYNTVTYAITYELDGGELYGGPTSYDIEHGTSIPEPSKTGYTFAGWSLRPDGRDAKKDYTIAAGNYGNKKLYAFYTPNNYTVTFDVNGGNPLSNDTATVTYDGYYSLPTPTRPGYEFAGWSRSKSKQIDSSGTWTIDKDVTLVANWNLLDYSVSYYLNGGTSTYSNKTTYTYEDSDYSVHNPTRTGYTFAGWRVNGGNVIENYVIANHSSGNLILEATWTANTYQITFDVDGGDDLTNNKINVTYDANYSLVQPTRPGYVFAGWYYGNTKISGGVWNIPNDVTLTAHWTREQYQITYNLNGGTNHALNPSGYNYDDETIALLPPEREGYTFIGWTTPDNNVPSNAVTIDHNSTGAKEFIANWQANTYQITYDLNGGTGVDELNEDVVFDTNHSSPVPTRPGYSFNGWFYNDNRVEDGIWKIGDNVTLTASWIANNYTITKVNGDGAGTQVVSYDGGYNLGTSHKDGYAFNGWFTGENGTGTQYTDENGNSLNNYTDTSDITLYGYFTYGVNFESNGGSEIASKTYKENENLEEGITPTKEGMTFGGWYTDSKLTKPVSYNESLGNITLYAKWLEEVQPQDLIYTEPSKGVVISSSSYDGESIVIPSHIGGKPVVEISANAFLNKTNATSLYVPDTVTTIGNGAFKGCDSLVDVTLPFVGNTPTSEQKEETFGYIFGVFTGVGDASYVTSAGKLNSGYNMTYQGVYSSKNTCYAIPHSIRNVTITSQNRLPNNAFRNCDLIENITIPTTTNIISNYAFATCVNLKRLNSNIDGVFNIPTAITAIPKYAFYNCQAAEKITLSNKVTLIGERAFADCFSLKYFNSDTQYLLNIPLACETINQYAFQNGSLFKEIIVPNTITYLESYAFSGFSAVESITVPFVGTSLSSTNKFHYVFSENGYPTTLKNVVITLDTTIPAEAFKNATNIESITIPQNTTSIGNNAFYNCTSLKRLNSSTEGVFNIPLTVKAIGDSAFYNCPLVTKVNLSNDIESIGNYAFYNCSSINQFNSDVVGQLIAPASCLTIGQNAFQNLSSITDIVVSNATTSIRSNAFSGCTSLESIAIPFVGESVSSSSTFSSIFGTVPATLKNVTITLDNSIPNDAFRGLANLESIVIPDSVTFIGQYAFYNCSSLKRLNSNTDGVFNIPLGVVEIRIYTFYKCSLAEEISLSNDVTYISQNAFAGCPLVSRFNSNIDGHLIIPTSCTSIGVGAFSGMVLITDLIVADNVTTISSEAFRGFDSLVNVYLPFVGNTLSNNGSADQNVFGYIFGYTTSSNVEGTTNSYSNVYYYIPQTIKNVVVTVQTVVPAYAFRNCSFIETITIPDSTTSIGGFAFYNCSSLKRLNSNTDGIFNIPTGVTSIITYSFYNCSLATKITLSDGIVQIGSYSFGNCSALEYFNSDTQYLLNIPSSCQRIDSYAFTNVVLTKEIFVPDTVTYIEAGVFTNCSVVESITVPFVGEKISSTNSFSYIFGPVPNTLKNVVITLDETIPTYAFRNLKNIENISIPSTSTSIGAYAFQNCTSLKRLNSNTDSVFNIPLTVITISDYSFYNCALATQFSMSNDVKSIGAYAFYNCPLVKRFNSNVDGNLIVPTSCTSIGTYAFQDMSLMAELNVGNLVTSIGAGAFKGCDALINVTLSHAGNTLSNTGSADQNVFGYIFGYTTSSNVEGTTNSYSNVYYYIPKTIKSVTITTQTSIGAYAFRNCSFIETITIPSSTTSIGAYAFENCTGLKRLNSNTDGVFNIPTGVTTISPYVFNNCSLVSKYTMGNITNIDTYAFANCPLVEYFNSDTQFLLNIPSSCIQIGTYAFTNLGLIEEIIISDSVTNIAQYAFQNSNSLESITVPFVGTSLTSTNDFSIIFGSVPNTLKNIVITLDETIPSSAFKNMSNVETITLCDSTTTIGAYAFQNCTSLKRLNSNTDGVFNIPTGVTEIKSYSFNGCSAAIRFTMGNEITAIRSYAFANCSLLEYFNSDTRYLINVPSSCQTVESYAFQNLALMTELYMPDSLTLIGQYTFSGCNSLIRVTIPFVGEKISSTNSFSYIFGTVPTTLRNIVITSDDTIPNSAFKELTNIESITIPSNTISIGSSAFYGCSSLKHLNSNTDGVFNIPTGVTEIAASSFRGCSLATKFTMSDDIVNIANYAFANCPLVEYFNSDIQYLLNIPSSCTKIGSYAFNNLGLIKEIKAPNTLTDISTYSFEGCNSTETITVPFIGITINSTSEFSVIFGSVPASLKNINITLDKTIPLNAFRNLSNVESITIPSNTISIGSSSFDNCSSLKRLNSNVDGVFNIPTTITDISDYAFRGCVMATTITLSNDIEFIRTYAFSGCSLVSKFNSSTEGNLIIPTSCTSIGSYAFQNMALIANLVVPETVNSIDSGAFKGCNSLVNLTIPFTGNTINASYHAGVFGYIFGWCTTGRFSSYSETTNYQTAFVNSSYTNYGTKESGTTWQWTSDSSNYGAYVSRHYYIPQTIRTVTITRQNVVKTAAFNNCSFIETINLPDSTTIIGDYAFQNCPATVNLTYAAIVSAPWDGSVALDFHSGSGTEEDPYIIFTSSEFAYFIEQVNSGNSFENEYIILTSDIDLNGLTIYPIGNSENIFAGSFNGQGNLIKNGKVNETNNQYCGIFGYVTGTIEKVGFVNITITSTISENGHYYVGPIAYLEEEGLIKNVYSTGSISITGGYNIYAGGLVGYQNGGTVRDCYSLCSVSASSSQIFAYSGGLVGYLQSGTIINSLATGNVTAKGSTEVYSRNGGLVGHNDNGTITNCYRSSSQTLTRYNSSGKSYNTDGESINLSSMSCVDLLELLTWSDTIWATNKSLPLLKKV